jgi:hypothetical protein
MCALCGWNLAQRRCPRLPGLPDGYNLKLGGGNMQHVCWRSVSDAFRHGRLPGREWQPMELRAVPQRHGGGHGRDIRRRVHAMHAGEVHERHLPHGVLAVQPGYVRRLRGCATLHRLWR